MLKKINKNTLIKIVAAAVILLCVFLSVDIVMSAVKNTFFAAPLPNALPQGLTPKKITTYPEYAQMLKNLFSTPGGKDAAGKKFELISVINAGNWDKINLSGTVLSDSVSLAVLEVDGKNYAVTKGEPLGDYRVKDIEKSAVIFEGNGEKKVIMLKYSVGAGLPVASEDNSSSSNTVLSREELNSLLEPPDRLAKEATFMPTQENGVTGVKLAYVKPGSLLQKVGLQQNDVLTEVNGESLKSGDDIFKAYQIFRNEDNISIKLKRGGKDVNVQLNVR